MKVPIGMTQPEKKFLQIGDSEFTEVARPVSCIELTLTTANFNAPCRDACVSARNRTDCNLLDR